MVDWSIGSSQQGEQSMLRTNEVSGLLARRYMAGAELSRRAGTRSTVSMVCGTIGTVSLARFVQLDAVVDRRDLLEVDDE